MVGLAFTPANSLPCTSMEIMRISPSAQRVLAVAALTVALVGCNLRVGSPPSPLPTPGAEEVSRQNAAIAVAEVIESAQSAQPAPVLTALADASDVYLDALGGMWVPPPRDEDPSPSAPVDLAREQPDGAITDEALLTSVHVNSDALLELAAQAGTDQAGTDRAEGDAHVGPAALVSMWLTWHTAAAAIAEEADLPCPEPCGSGGLSPVLEEALSPGEPPAAVADLIEAVPLHAPELIGLYDALGYVEQVRAARSGDEDRDALAARARELRRVGNLLAGESAGTDRDPRLSAYPLEVDDLPGTSEQLSGSAAENWLALYPHLDAPAREVAIEILWFTYTAANPGGEVETWPGLPAP